MGVPTSGSATITIDARPEAVYDLVADVTRMGEWSPECVSCEWLDTPGAEGSRFRGRNRNGPARWTTTAKVLRADRGREFTLRDAAQGRRLDAVDLPVRRRRDHHTHRIVRSRAASPS